jgi:tetratricopeptide (TPR) repeat protein/tRNA A-37 threonylcarbamoyl transferase component Bud32
MEDLVGRELGRYQVTALVGRGGMATVYKALDPVLDRAVAIKVMHTHLAADPTFVGRFRHEAQAVAALRHPNIVKVFDFGSEAEAYYMVMEFIDGPTLAALLESRAGEKVTPTGSGPGAIDPAGRVGGLYPSEILRIFKPLCSAIDYATTRGMVHRDIKPANILLTQEGEPILTDYGIAKIMGATSYTVSGVVMGSAHYMSPEQVQGFPMDHRTDIYSLGIVLFEALAGRVPFDADTTASILAQHISAPVPAAQSINPSLPSEVQAVLERALAKAPENRYQRAWEMAASLQAALAPLTGRRPDPIPLAGAGQAPTVVLDAAAPTRVERVTTVEEAGEESLPGLGGRPRQVGRGHMRRWLILAAAMVVVIVGVVVGVVLATSGGGTVESTTSTFPGSASSTSLAVSTSSTTQGDGTATSGSGGEVTITTLLEQASYLIDEGDAFVQSGRFDEGIEKYEEALGVDPDSDVARTQLGIVYYLHGAYSYEGAQQQLELATEKNPANARAWAFLGLARVGSAYKYRTGDYASAETALQTAMELDPNSALGHAFLGRLLAASGRSDEALTEMQTALDLGSQDPWVLESAGWINAVQGDWTDSVPYYNLAATYEPNWATFLSVLAEALRETEKYDEALGYYNTVLQLDQGYEASAYEDIGVTLWDKGDSPGAITNLKKALELDDTRDYAHWAIGAIWDEQEDYEAALPHLQRAVALVPNNAGYQEWLADCLFYLGRYAEARAAVDKSLALDPNRPGAQRISEDLKAKGY